MSSRLLQGARLAEGIVSDLAGDLFAGKIQEYKGNAALRTWLTVVARNRLTDTLRSESRRGVSLRLWASGEPLGHSDGAKNDLVEDVTERLYAEMATEVLRDELKRLFGDERLLISRYFEDEIPMRLLVGECGVNRTQVGRRIRGICAKIRLALIDRGVIEPEQRTDSIVNSEEL